MLDLAILFYLVNKNIIIGLLSISFLVFVVGYLPLMAPSSCASF